MPGIDPLCEGVSLLLRAAKRALPASGLGVVRADDADSIVRWPDTDR